MKTSLSTVALITAAVTLAAQEKPVSAANIVEWNSTRTQVSYQAEGFHLVITITRCRNSGTLWALSCPQNNYRCHSIDLYDDDDPSIFWDVEDVIKCLRKALGLRGLP